MQTVAALTNRRPPLQLTRAHVPDVSVILNPAAGTAGQADSLRATLAARADVELLETHAPGDARHLASRAVASGSRRVIAAGGDGTINEVVNGLVVDGRVSVAFGVVPLGTGNDLARTLALPTDLEAALNLALTGSPRALDLIVTETQGRSHYGANAASGGFSGQVDEALSGELKATWGPLAYLLGAIKVLPAIATYETRIQFEDEAWERIEALNVMVANGRTIGGGKQIAAPANPEDGWLDVVVVRNGSAIALAAVAARLVAGTLLASDLVSHRRARVVRVESRPGMWFNLDGELLTNETITFRCLPRGLPCIVGAEYRPEPS